MFTVAVSLTGDAHAAADCLQDVFVSLARSAGKIRIQRNLKGYLLSSIVNRTRDRLRRQKVRPVEISIDDTNRCADQPGPLDALIDHERSNEVFNALAQLPEEQREVVTLRTQGGLTFRQIAGFQGESINTIQSRYRYGIKKLQTLLKKEHENE